MTLLRLRTTGLAVVASIACSAAVAACATSDGPSFGRESAVGTVQPARMHRPTIAVDVDRGCPRSVGAAVDVADDFSGRGRALLPQDRPVTSGLVCVYSAGDSGTTPSRLRHPTHLATAAARHLAATIARVSLAPQNGPVSCPADFAGAETIIAFGYGPRRTVDLWYKTSGCRTLDNGTVIASFVASPSFARFQDVLAGVT